MRPVQQGIESSCKQEPALAIACATSSPAQALSMRSLFRELDVPLQHLDSL